MTDIIKRKPSSFEEDWLASKAWERKGVPLGTARALVNAGYLTVEDLQSVPLSELAALPRVGKKSLTILIDLYVAEASRRLDEPAKQQPRAHLAGLKGGPTRVLPRGQWCGTLRSFPKEFNHPPALGGQGNPFIARSPARRGFA